jgi:tripartite-type tricarboxylate transporter receptor subunit TctC
MQTGVGQVAPGSPLRTGTTTGSSFAALATPELRARLAALDVEPIGSTPEELGRFLRAEYEKWNEMIRSVGIAPE